VRADRRRSAAGYTLVELLVALVLLSLALALANGLLLESIRIFSTSGRELREPASELALRLLREDLRASAPVTSMVDLDCRRADRVERWAVDDGRLYRTSLALDGTPIGRRPMLDRMVSFRWTTIGPGLVQVDLVRRRPDGTSAMRAGTSAWRSDGETLEVATVIAGSRIATW